MERKGIYLDIFLKRHDSVMLMLEKITTSKAFDPDRRNTADSTQNLFSSKQFIASVYLFREIFVMIGFLSLILQGVNIEIVKTSNILDAALKQLL